MGVIRVAHELECVIVLLVSECSVRLEGQTWRYSVILIYSRLHFGSFSTALIAFLIKPIAEEFFSSGSAQITLEHTLRRTIQWINAKMMNHIKRLPRRLESSDGGGDKVSIPADDEKHFLAATSDAVWSAHPVWLYGNTHTSVCRPPPGNAAQLTSETTGCSLCKQHNVK